MIRYTNIATPVGPMYATLAGEGLAGLYFHGGRHAPAIAPDWREDATAAPFTALARQLEAYFAGTLREFDLPLAPLGTAFQRRVWDEIARIAYGKTLTYAQLAWRVGSPDAVRAVGAATGRNPLSIVVPCHRVVGTDGSLTGYAGGLERKRELLELEGLLQLQLV